MSGQKEWLAAIADAADDLGYLIETIEPQRIVLHPMKGSGDLRIILDGFLFDGDDLRRYLRSALDEPTP
jgi:hypothetical protein